MKPIIFLALMFFIVRGAFAEMAPVTIDPGMYSDNFPPFSAFAPSGSFALSNPPDLSTPSYFAYGFESPAPAPGMAIVTRGTASPALAQRVQIALL